MKRRFVIGIDLGTTNCALAYVDLQETGPELRIKTFEIPQLVGSGRLGQRTTLPSFLYLPGPYEEDDLGLPWDPERNYAVGVYARDHGALLPARLVSSAKSWLCHGGVDREAKILPWGAGEDVDKVSPVEASARYLLHLKEAWNYEMAKEDPAARLENQLIILTVPASFDEVARELTLKAARLAGLEVILLEEPVAALYAWLSEHEKDWADILEAGDHLLVCDIGGGTSDFTVVEVRRGASGLELERIAVGDHILLGGDNIDLSIARLAERKLPVARLDFARFQTLTFLCRELKERLLSPDGPEEDAVRLPGRGRALIADTVVAKITRAEILSLVQKEFFPEVAFNASLARLESVPKVMREWGLPYARDPAITKHLGSFLYKRQIKRIDAVLFNGGALKPPVFRQRILEELARWYQKKDFKELETVSLDLAVAIGAAYYGLVREGLGIRVGGGLPRAYYLGVEEDTTPKAICLAPKGTKEGERLVLPRKFKVLTNRPVKFPIFTSSLRDDQLGELVTINQEEFVPLPPLTTVLKFGRKSGIKEIPVEVEVYLSEVGVLETYCRSLETPHRWRLQFNLRAETASEEVPEGVIIKKEARQELPVDEALITRAQALIRKAFTQDKEELVSLTRRLEEIFEMERDRWPLALLRTLAEELIELKEARRKTALHETRWLNLSGFTMRPGYGEPLDPFRIRKLWSLYFEGPFHQSDRAVAVEWWIFWRRIAGGLNQAQQEQLLAKIKSALWRKKGKVSAQERKEMLLCLANLEKLTPQTKLELLKNFLPEVKKKIDYLPLFIFKRLLARELLYGPANCVIPAAQAETVVREFLNALQQKPLKEKQKRLLAETLLTVARFTGDRVRDLSEETRKEAATLAQSLGLNPEALKGFFELRPLARQEASSLFGESLPLGLKLAA